MSEVARQEVEDVLTDLYGNEIRRVPQRIDRKVHEPQKLYDLHHEILRRLTLGQKPKGIARALNVSPQTVYNIRNSILGSEELERKRALRDFTMADAAQVIEEIIPEGIQTIVAAMRDEEASWTTRMRASEDLVFRLGGMEAPKKIEGKMLHAHLSPDQIEELRDRGRSLAKELGYIVEVKEE